MPSSAYFSGEASPAYYPALLNSERQGRIQEDEGMDPYLRHLVDIVCLFVCLFVYSSIHIQKAVQFKKFKNLI